jgi:hypothetical protein
MMVITMMVIVAWCDSDAILDVLFAQASIDGIESRAACGMLMLWVLHQAIIPFCEENNGRVGSLVRVIENLTPADGYRMSTSLDDTNWKNGATAQKEVTDSDNVFTSRRKNNLLRRLWLRTSMVASQCRFDQGGE